MPVYKRPKEEFKVYSNAEIDLIMLTSDERLKPILALTWLTGARIGEVMKVSIDDIDVNGKEVMIRLITEKVKDHPVRELYFDLDTTPFLEDDIIPFYERRVKMFGIRRAQQLLVEACKKAGIQLTFHELRHSRLTYLARKLRATASEMMDWTGWTSSSQINTYVIREAPKRFKRLIR